MTEDGYYGISRGSAKTSMSYKASMRRHYDEGRISLEDYVIAIGTWLILVDGCPEDEVLEWVKNELQKGD